MKKKMGIMMKFASAAITNKFLLVVFVASIVVTISSAFSTTPRRPSILDVTSGVSQRSLSAQCRSSSRHYYNHHHHHPVGQVSSQQVNEVREEGYSSSPKSRLISVPAGIVLPLLLSSMIAVSPALATISDNSAAATSAAKIFNNAYADPLHPLCERKIQVSKDGTSFHYSGTAVGLEDDTGVLRGCSQAEIKQYTLRKGAFDGLVLDGGTRISAGDGIHEGVWEAKNTATDPKLAYPDVDGIRWNDGNKWIVASQAIIQNNANGQNEVVKKPMSTVIGEFITFSYISFSGLAGVKGVTDAIKRKQQEQ
jgi:hypothetical protein